MKDRRWAVKQFMKSTPDFMTVVHNSLNRIYKKIKNQKNKITFRLKLGGGGGGGREEYLPTGKWAGGNVFNKCILLFDIPEGLYYAPN